VDVLLEPAIPIFMEPINIALVNVAFWLRRRYFAVELPRQVVA
jgi:hypothetical protein